MTQATGLVTTAEQLAALPDDGQRYELVDGVLHMMSPAGGQHGRIAATLLYLITRHVREKSLGVTFAAETGFLLRRDPDTVRAPDVAFVSRERMADWSDHPGYLPLAPDLVAEVVSPSDSSSQVEGKARDWLDAGVRLVLIVDPQSATIRVYRSRDPIQVFSQGLIDLQDVLAEFQLDVDEVFS
ncbi:MAG: Uma2 family endonuclease [Pirellulaceae bacterium]|nr:Uma2 family endonuclease [Pirellulaceae bacterium]